MTHELKRLKKENEIYRNRLEEIHAWYCSRKIESFTGELNYSECFGALQAKRALQQVDSKCFEKESYVGAMARLNRGGL